MKPIALLTESRYLLDRADPDDWYRGNILEEDRLLAEALAALGFASERVDWRAEVDWSGFECAVFRTTWNYFERFDEFRAWLERIDSQTRLLNPVPLVRWNLDKRYLADLECAGVATVPTRLVGRGEPVTLCDVARETGWTEMVLKPVVSACAFQTYRVSATDESRWRELIEQRDMLVQRFEPNILDEGEVTVMVLGGEVTHAVRKCAKPGDFRVQDDHGGTVHTHEPAADEVALAVAATAACDPSPVYGRIDMVRGADGTPRVMELELVEPELWLRVHPPAARRMARAIAAALG